MSFFMQALFWAGLLILLYTYAGYPLLLMFLTYIRRSDKGITAIKDTFHPIPVTLVVAAYNEEEVLKEKAENSLGLDYPENLLQLLFITDGSTDNSNDILAQYPRIKVLHQPERQGKLAAINRAMESVSTELVIFTDANNFLNKEAIKNLVPHYTDPLVGGVTGEKKIITLLADGSVAQGEGLYWKYESYLKYLDSSLHTVVGAAGELFSMRTLLYTQLPKKIILDDFVQSLTLCIKGYTVKYEPAAFAEERASLSIKDEMERKIRISAGGFQAMGAVAALFNVFKYPVVFFQFISHRILRWTLCPLALIACLLSCIYLSIFDDSLFYRLMLVLQGLLYLSGMIGWFLSSRNQSAGITYAPFYFLFMHFCVFAGFWRFVLKRQNTLWAKASRQKKI